MAADPHRVLITGGAGFVGANLAVALAARHPDWELVALDNLHRRGSELNLPRLEAAGVEFVRADVREREALLAIAELDALVECSAEPSALVGMSGDTSYPFETNLVGAYNCLELARRDGAQFVFLSTSRVYPYRALSELELSRSRAVRARRRPGSATAPPRPGSRSASRSTARARSTARPSSPPSCWSPSTPPTSGSRRWSTAAA